MPDTIERLQDCLESTDWNVFEEGNNLHTFTETETAYIKLCQGVCTPSKHVMQYPNSRPWCIKTIKAETKAKAFLTKSSDQELNHRTKGDLLEAIRDAKKALRDRLEKKFASNNSRDIWSSIHSITKNKGHKTTVSSDHTNLQNKPNNYYARFDKGNLSSPFLARNSDTMAPFNISMQAVKTKVKLLSEKKATEAEGATPKLFKTCADQHGEVYTSIFN